MTPELYFTYFAATLAVCLTPGPAVLLASSQGLSAGVRAGALAALGIQAANSIYWLVFVLGLGAIIATSGQLFTVIKYAGAAYLVILGILTICNARHAAHQAQSVGPTAVWRAPFFQGVVNQFANPKAMLFLIVLVPQFVTPGRTTPLDFLALALTAMGLDFAVLTGYAWIAARSGALFRDPLQIIWRERAAGAAQIAVGGMIAAMRRAA